MGLLGWLLANQNSGIFKTKIVEGFKQPWYLFFKIQEHPSSKMPYPCLVRNQTLQPCASHTWRKSKIMARPHEKQQQKHGKLKTLPALAHLGREIFTSLSCFRLRVRRVAAVKPNGRSHKEHFRRRSRRLPPGQRPAGEGRSWGISALR